MLIALVNNYTVVEIKTLTEEEYHAISPSYQAAIQIDDLTPQPQVGWLWDGINFSSNGVSSVPSGKISKLAFRNRFTAVEKVMLRTAINSNVQIAALYDDFVVSEFVDLARADTIEGVGYLVLAGLITEQRGQEILNNPVTETEKWRG